MKVKLFVAFAATLLLTSCYDEYIKDHDFDGIYFVHQTNVRTLVLGEGMTIKVGAALGGVLDNKKDRSVIFSIKDELVAPSILEMMKAGLPYVKEAVEGVEELIPLPSSYLKLSNESEMLIKKGQHMGAISLTVDSAMFVSDPKTLKAHYAVPFYIESADCDSIIEQNRYTVIGLKYEHMLFGNYYHGGKRIIKDENNNPIDTVYYYTTIPQSDNLNWRLKTISPNELESDKLSNGLGKESLRIRLLSDGEIVISKSSSSSINILNDGKSFYNKAKLLQNRKLFLNYKFENGDGTISHVTDTLTFRNRIRDGVNEWQDENAENYE